VDDVDVGVPEPAGGDQDAVRVGDPTGVGGPEIVRGHVGESGGADRLKEPAAEAVVALLPMGGVSLAAGKRERVRVIGQRGEVLLDELHDLARGSARRHLAECHPSIRVNSSRIKRAYARTPSALSSGEPCGGLCPGSFGRLGELRCDG
jgi:hypothetical protein